MNEKRHFNIVCFCFSLPSITWKTRCWSISKWIAALPGTVGPDDLTQLHGYLCLAFTKRHSSFIGHISMLFSICFSITTLMMWSRIIDLWSLYYELIVPVYNGEFWANGPVPVIGGMLIDMMVWGIMNNQPIYKHRINSRVSCSRASHPRYMGPNAFNTNIHEASLYFTVEYQEVCISYNFLTTLYFLYKFTMHAIALHCLYSAIVNGCLGRIYI